MKYLILTLVLLLTACNPSKERVSAINGNDGIDGANGAAGQDGSNGLDGRDGEDGTSCAVAEAFDDTNTTVIGALLSCSDGSSQIVLNGSNGLNGAAGADGIQGQPGNSCSILREADSDRVAITCGDSTLYVYDGDDGEDGIDGEDGRDGVDGEDGEDGSNGINANGCTLEHLPNNGGQGNKFRITCGSVSTTFTGV